MIIRLSLCLSILLSVCSSSPYRGSYSMSSSYSSSSSFGGSPSSTINRRSSSVDGSFKPHWHPGMGPNSGPPSAMAPPPRRAFIRPGGPTAPPGILNKGNFNVTANLPTSQNSVIRDSGCRSGSKLYHLGDKWTSDGGCERHTCNQGGKVSTLGCPTPEATDGCTVSSTDPRQPWPQCCPKLICTPP